MSNIFQKGILQNVFYDMGSFDDARKLKKCVLAPFKLLKLPDGLYIQPSDTFAFGGPGASSTVGHSLSGIIGTDNQDEAFYQGRGDFFLEDKSIVMGEHELGDYQGRPNDWVGLFDLGMI